MGLDLFTIREKNLNEELHPKFLLLKDNLLLKRQREIVESWTDGFIDRDGKIVEEFQVNFHQSFWEFYLHAVFKELDFEIDMTKPMPDFVVNKPIPFNVEAVVPGIKNNGRKESTRTFEETLGGFYPIYKEEHFEEIINEAITRQSSSFIEKYDKYHKTYKTKEWVKGEKPFVLAVGSFDQVNYGREYLYSMVPLLYGYYYDKDAKKFVKKDYIIKPGTVDSDIPIGIFNKKENSHISAVIFSCTLTLGKLFALVNSETPYTEQMNRVINIRDNGELVKFNPQFVSMFNPEELSDGLLIFHNPNADIKLPLDVFEDSYALQVTFTDKFEFTGIVNPLVARVNSSRIFIDPFLKSILNDIHVNYNDMSLDEVIEKGIDYAFDNDEYDEE